MSDALATLFGSKTKARVLDVLLSQPDASFHLRGLAQAAGTDSGNTSKLLKLLVDCGLVRAIAGQPATRYAIDTRSPLVGPLRQLVAAAGQLMQDLREVALGLPADYVGVYGSVAAGTAGAGSDVDVLVVGDIGTVAAQAAFKPVARRHGKAVNVVTVTAAELQARLREGGAFWAAVASGRKIDLKGAWSDVALGTATAG